MISVRDHTLYKKISRTKWEERCKRIPNKTSILNSLHYEKSTNLISKCPIELVRYINLLNNFYHKCTCINNISHLRSCHSFNGPSIIELITWIQEIKKEQQNRKATISKVRDVLRSLVNSLRCLLAS